MKERKKLKRGRKSFKHLSAKEQLQRARERNKELGITPKRRKFLYLICQKCKQERKIHTNNADIYTDEIRNNYICVLCK